MSHLSRDDEPKACLEHIERLDDMSERATRYLESERQLGFRQSIKLHRRAVFWVIYGQLVVFGFGIDGIIAAYLIGIPRFREDFGQAFTVDGVPSYIIPAWWLSLFAGVSQLTAIIGAMSAGYLADKIGRKRTLALSCAVSVAGVAAQFAAKRSLTILCVGKGINGLPVGMWLVLGPLYASEVAPLALRGWLTAMTNLIQFCGVLLFTGVTYHLGPMPSKISYQIPIACQWIVPSIVLLTFWAWPESPAWLVCNGKVEKARKSMLRLYGKNPIVDTEGLLAAIHKTITEEREASKNDSKSYLECFQKQHRYRTLICMFIYGCQYLSGLVFILGYQTYFYQLIGYSAQKSFLLTMLNNVSQFIANILSWFLLSWLGRRPLITWGQLCGAVCLFIVAGTSMIGTVSGYMGTVAFVFIWAFSYQLTLGTVAWTVVAEIPALRLRARTQGLANLTLCFTQWLIGFIFPYMFNPDAGNLGGKVGFVFGATSFLGFVGVLFFLPETKNRTAYELDKLFGSGIPAWKFSKTKVEVSGVDEQSSDA